MPGRMCPPPLSRPLLLLLLLYQAVAAGPGRCRRLGTAWDGHPLVRCDVASLNAELDPSPLQLAAQEAVHSLYVTCVEAGVPHGPLLPGAFRLFPQVEDLRIEQCLIPELTRASLDGLQQLKNFTFRTNGIEWSTAASLKLHGDTFSDLSRLELLDLGGNNLWSLPAGIFCQLNSLLTINLTNNRLSDLTNVSRATDGGCRLAVRQLDASGNQLTALSGHQLPGLAQLRRLLVDRNEIKELSERFLQGLPALRVLNVSNNQLTALPPDVFRAGDTLRELYLNNNNMRVIAPGVFSELKHLEVLDLSSNQLSDNWVNADTLDSLPSLHVLRLANNNITRLPTSMLTSMPHLRTLALGGNALRDLAADGFQSLGELQDLDLSGNRIARLVSGVFNGLGALTQLSLRGNVLSEVDPAVFDGAPRLVTLDLAKNRLVSVPAALSTLTSLRSLDISDNRIGGGADPAGVIPPELLTLQMEGNRISDLVSARFSRLPRLRALNLARNEIVTLSPDVFRGLKNLQMLRLDSNRIGSIRDSLAELDSLKWLNVSNNLLITFDYGDIPRRLEWLDLHANQIASLENSQQLENELQIRTLDLSFNRITTLSPFQLPDRLETFIANDNIISQVYPYTFLRKQNITRVDLFSNRISTIDINAFRLNLPADRARPQFYIGGNPLLCDCHAEWLAEFATFPNTSQYPQLVDLDTVFCQLAFNVQRDYMPLVEVPRSQFLCNYTRHCAPLCQCCQFDACDCEMMCPHNCTCYHTADWSGNIVDCTTAGQRQVPDRIPMDATELYLDGNRLPGLSSHAFIGRRRLLVLYLNASRIDRIANRTFAGLTSLQVLHLEHNDIERLRGFEFDTLSLLRELYLHRNSITSINNRTFWPLVSLEVLRLDGNRLMHFSVLQLGRNGRLTFANVTDNPWTCDCDMIEALRSWLELGGSAAGGGVIADADRLMCYPNSSEPLQRRSPLAVLDYNTTACNFFNNTIATRVYGTQSTRNYVLLVIVAVIALLIVIMAVVMYIYWHEMRVLAYAKYGVRIFTPAAAAEADREKLFDAFVSYSAKDEPFVVEVLARELETAPPRFRLCLHHRDFPARTYVADTIVQAIESSRRTIMVLSDHFIKGEWSRYEFKSAHHQVLNGRRRQLIVIMAAGVSARELDPDLRLYLKTGTVLRRDDRLFWEKLRFALPDVRRLQQKNNLYDYPMAVHL